MKKPIRLRGISGDIKGKIWEAETLLRSGRVASLEIVLDDNSVSRKHAEVRLTADGWAVTDLDSTNGTYVNGVRLEGGGRVLKSRDIVQFGKVAMIVELPDSSNSTSLAGQSSGALNPNPGPGEQILVEATSSSSWEDALIGLAYDRQRVLRPGDQFMALLRAGHHLVHIENEDDLLHSILNDAVQVLDAQRGAIVLADGPNGDLKLRAIASGRRESAGRFNFSRKLAERCYTKGESILSTNIDADAELKVNESIHDGGMSSVLSVLLRTPRKRLGVLHLDRSYLQKDFTEDDLHLADALAANVSAGIETASLMRKQRELFLNVIKALAQAVETRDEYTGGHTARVTSYSLLLAQQLNVSAKEMKLLEMGAPLHDVGKIGVDDSILRKPGRLTPEEFEQMKLHTTKGAELIQTIPDLHPILPIVRSHHERWDGAGYPDGLAAEATPLLARILAVADAFDAMTSNRPYHPEMKGRPPEYAFGEIRDKAGKQFDPVCAAAFLAIQAKILGAMAAHNSPEALSSDSSLSPTSFNQIIG